MNAPRARTHLTVRSLPADVSRALDAERRRRAKSLNQTVVELLGESLGLERTAPRKNGLQKLAGRWSARDQASFDRATSVFEQIDEEIWR